MPHGISEQSTGVTHQPTCDERSYSKALAAALQTVSYEVLPFVGTGDLVAANLPPGSAITVTTTHARLEATIDLAAQLSGAGYRVAPHVAARAVRGEGHLADIAGRLQEAGIDRIFIVGGDIDHPVGPFADALGLIEALQQHDYSFSSIGIAGYPEGHGSISPALIEAALNRKSLHASEIVTQLCFDPTSTVRWARGVKRQGIELPIRVGIPGAVPRRKLARISARLGLGPSARFISKQHGMLGRFFMPGGYHPKRLVDGLVPWLASDETNIAGFHLFTFNELHRTETWRREWLNRLDQSAST